MLIVNGNTLIPKEKETILDTINRYKIPIYSGCTSGYCGACRCKKVKGDAIQLVEPLAFVRENELLTCISKYPENGDLVLTV